MDTRMVLLVDDDEHTRTYLKTVLAALQAEVIEASNGVDALRLVNDLGTSIDLVVSDVVMPRMDGVALANAIGELFPAMPVVLVSGSPTGDWPQQPNGRCTILQKPISPEALLRAVRMAMSEAGRWKPGSSTGRVAG